MGSLAIVASNAKRDSSKMENKSDNGIKRDCKRHLTKKAFILLKEHITELKLIKEKEMREMKIKAGPHRKCNDESFLKIGERTKK